VMSVEHEEHPTSAASIAWEESYEGALRKLVGKRRLIIVGTRSIVRDERGRPVVGASVAAWRTGWNVLRWGTTDAEGRLVLEDVRVGAVRVTAPG